MKFLVKTPIEIIYLGIWLVLFLLVSPFGEFPINDDVIYSKTVKFFLENGELNFFSWPAMTLVSQSFLGVLFCKIFGFSFINLRILTLLLSAICSYAFFKLIHLITKDKLRAFLFSLVLIFNPIYFSLSFTFMTEIYFLTFFVLSLLFYYKASQSNKTWHFALASAFAGLTIFVRQTGLILPILFGFTYLLKNRWSIKSMLIAILPIALLLSIYLGYTSWVTNVNLTGKLGKLEDLTEALNVLPFDFFIRRLGMVLFYVGLMLMPLAFMMIGHVQPAVIKKRIVPSLLFCVALSSLIIYSWKPVLGGNILYNFGLGPKLLKDTFWGDNLSIKIGRNVWHIIKLVSLIGLNTLILLTISIRDKQIFSLKQKLKSSNFLFRFNLGIICIAYLTYLSINPNYFDRYTLPLAASVMILIASKQVKLNLKKASVGLGLLCIFVLTSIGLSRDFFSWNRARWKALNYLTQEKNISDQRIDGGFEFNMWYESGPYSPIIKGRKSWWRVNSDEYVLSAGSIEGYTKLKTFAYKNILPPSTDSVYILWREEIPQIPYSAYPILCDFEKTTNDSSLFSTSNNSMELTNVDLLSSKYSRSGNHSVKLNKDNPYGPTYVFRNVNPGEYFKISIWVYGKNSDAGIVLATNTGKSLYEYRNKPITNNNSYAWEFIGLDLVIPDNIDDHKVGFFLFHKGGEPVWFDDLKIIRKQQ